MPFRFAAYVIIAMIGTTIVAFWPSYFSTLTSAPWGFHFHGITASLWMLLLAFQRPARCRNAAAPEQDAGQMAQAAGCAATTRLSPS